MTTGTPEEALLAPGEQIRKDVAERRTYWTDGAACSVLRTRVSRPKSRVHSGNTHQQRLCRTPTGNVGAEPLGTTYCECVPDSHANTARDTLLQNVLALTVESAV